MIVCERFYSPIGPLSVPLMYINVYSCMVIGIERILHLSYAVICLANIATVQTYQRDVCGEMSEMKPNSQRTHTHTHHNKKLLCEMWNVRSIQSEQKISFINLFDIDGKNYGLHTKK